MKTFFGRIETPGGYNDLLPINTTLASEAFNQLWDTGKGFTSAIVYLTVYDTDPSTDPKAKVWYKARLYTKVFLALT